MSALESLQAHWKAEKLLRCEVYIDRLCSRHQANYTTSSSFVQLSVPSLLHLLQQSQTSGSRAMDAYPLNAKYRKPEREHSGRSSTRLASFRPRTSRERLDAEYSELPTHQPLIEPCIGQGPSPTLRPSNDVEPLNTRVDVGHPFAHFETTVPPSYCPDDLQPPTQYEDEALSPTNSSNTAARGHVRFHYTVDSPKVSKQSPISLTDTQQHHHEQVNDVISTAQARQKPSTLERAKVFIEKARDRIKNIRSGKISKPERLSYQQPSITRTVTSDGVDSEDRQRSQSVPEVTFYKRRFMA